MSSTLRKSWADSTSSSDEDDPKGERKETLDAIVEEEGKETEEEEEVEETEECEEEGNTINYTDIVYVDTQFLKAEYPDTSMCKILSIKPEYKEWVRIFDIVTDDDANSLELYHYITPKDEEKSREVLAEVGHVRGMLVENRSKVIIRSYEWLPEMNLKEFVNSRKKINKEEKLSFEICIEGTLLRVYYWGKKWRVSTHRKINAYNSRWMSDKTFGDMFNELGGNDITSNDNPKTRKEQYHLLIRHLEFRTMYPISVGQIFNVDHRTDVDDISNEFVKTLPTTNKFDLNINYSSLKNLKKLVIRHKSLIVRKDGVAICKLCSREFTDRRKLWGNEPSVRLRFISMYFLKDKTNKRLFKATWPEYEDIYTQVKRDVRNLVEHLLRKYKERISYNNPRNRKHNTKKLQRLPRAQYMVITKLNEWHRLDPKENIVTHGAIRNILGSIPIKYISTMLSYKEKEIEFEV